jgi:hypothetical protein
MGFWHTGYMEFHEPTGIGDLFRPAKIVYVCPHCPSSFEDADSLRRHRFEAHPFRRPVLFVRGVELGATAFRVSQASLPGDFVAQRTAAAKLNGRSIAPSDLPGALAKLTFDRARVELFNEGASAEFELSFRVASATDLQGVNEALVKLTKRKKLDIASVESFIGDCKPFPTADGYCNGVCHYLYGVLAKERAPDCSLPYESYRSRFTRAADELLDFDVPLARLIRSLVAFHFNHFLDAAAAAPTKRLRIVGRKFATLLTGQPWTDSPATERDGGGTREDLLTDHETVRVLRWSSEPLAAMAHQTSDIAAFAKRDIPEFDRVKLRLLLAESNAAVGNSKEARQHARELIGNPKTMLWAERLLERVPE